MKLHYICILILILFFSSSFCTSSTIFRLFSSPFLLHLLFIFCFLSLLLLLPLLHHLYRNLREPYALDNWRGPRTFRGWRSSMSPSKKVLFSHTFLMIIFYTYFFILHPIFGLLSVKLFTTIIIYENSAYRILILW